MPPRFSAIIADDDKTTVRHLIAVLNELNFEVSLALDSNHALQLVTQHKPELIITEVNKKDYDGVSLYQSIRDVYKAHNFRMIVMTDVRDEESEIMSYEVGVDYYLHKPVKQNVLKKRIQRLFDQSLFSKSNKNLPIEFAHYMLNPADKSVFDKEKGLLINMQFKSFDILYLLASNPSKIFNRDQIKGMLWTSNASVSLRTVDVHILKIRELIGYQYIQTIKGVGYKFMADVQVI